MKSIFQKKEDKQIPGAVVAGVAGAVVVAGAAVAATMALKDKKSRKKVKKVLVGVKDNAMEYMKTIQAGLKKEEKNVPKRIVKETKKLAKTSSIKEKKRLQ